MTKTTLFTSYYVALAAVLLSALVYTGLQASQVVGYGARVAELESQRVMATQQLNIKSQELAASQSLGVIRNQASSSAYQPIATTVVVTVPTQVALSY